MRNSKTLFLLWLFLLLCGVSQLSNAAPQVGWYWNPNESGRGFFVESQNGVTFIGAYLYDTDGHALWLVSGGPNDDPYNFTGELYNKTNGQTLFGTYVPPGDAVVVGQLSVHFSDDTHATVTWPGGTVQVERQIFGTGDASFQPDSGWWWNPDESGSGYSVELQGSNLFLVGFMYDPSGRPVWYFSAGPMTDAATYHGDVLQFANGQTMGGPYQPPGTPIKVATLDIVFTAENEATATFTDTSGTAKTARPKAGPRSNKLQPQFPKKGKFVFPDRFAVAAFDLQSVFADQVAAGTWTVTAGTSLRESFTAPGAFRQYAQSGQSSIATLTLHEHAFDCTASGSLDYSLPDDAVQLRVTSFSQYTVTLNIPFQILNATFACTDSTDTFPFVYGGQQLTHTGVVNSQNVGGGYERGSIHDKWHFDLSPGVYADVVIAFFAIYGK